MPNCVYIKASSDFEDMVKYNAFKFNICFIQIVYIHLEGIRTFRYNSYEWYMPVDMQPGIVWTLNFYLVV